MSNYPDNFHAAGSGIDATDGNGWEAMHEKLCDMADRVSELSGKALALSNEDDCTCSERLDLAARYRDAAPLFEVLRNALANLERAV
jgi:hypothetical protein